MATTFRDFLDPDEKPVYGVEGFGEMVAKQKCQGLMVTVKGCINNALFGCGSVDAEEGANVMIGLKKILKCDFIVLCN